MKSRGRLKKREIRQRRKEKRRIREGKSDFDRLLILDSEETQKHENKKTEP